MSHEFPAAPSFDEALAALKIDDHEVQRLVLSSPDVRSVHQAMSDLYGLVRAEVRGRGVVPITLHANNRDVIGRCDKLATALMKVGDVVEWMCEKAYADLSPFNAFVEKPAAPVHSMEFPPPDDPITPVEGEVIEGETQPPSDGPPQEEPGPVEGETIQAEPEAAPVAEALPEASDPDVEAEPQAPPATNRGRKGK